MALLARAAAADPAFNDFAQGLGSLQAVDAWIRVNFAYRDEYEEIVRDPRFMLADMGRDDNGRTVALEGDCDDIATFAAAMASVLGYPARLVAIRYSPGNANFEHVCAQAYDGSNWIVLDATVQPGTIMEPIEIMTEAI